MNQISESSPIQTKHHQLQLKFFLISTFDLKQNKYLDWPSRENFLAYRKAKNIFNSLNKKAKQDHFKRAVADVVIGNRKFWNTVKPFLTSKGKTIEQ